MSDDYAERVTNIFKPARDAAQGKAVVQTLHTLDREWGPKGAVFTSVRLGTKYANAAGAEFELCECSTVHDTHSVVGRAVVMGVDVTPLDRITAYTLSTNYAEECASWRGLWAALKRAYGDQLVAAGQDACVLSIQRVE